MTIDTLDTTRILERGIAFINKLVTPGGSPRSTGDKVKDESSGLNLRGVWNAINGMAAEEDHAGYAIELLREDGLAANIAGAYFTAGDDGVRKVLRMVTTPAVTNTIISCLPLTSMEELISALEAKRVDVVSTVAGQPLNPDFGECLEEYIRESMSVSRFDIPSGDAERYREDLIRVYSLVGGNAIKATDLHEASRLLTNINPKIRIGEIAGHSLRCHADRLSAALWLRTGEVVPAAHAMIARKVYILASSMSIEEELGDAILLHCILVENVANAMKNAFDPTSLVGLVPSLMTTENLMNRIAARHGDYKYILPVIDADYNLFGPGSGDLVGMLCESRDALNEVLTSLRTEGFDGNVTPVRVGGATVATPFSPKPKGALQDALDELGGDTPESDTRRGTSGALF